jgi:hypothetical protein
MQKICLSLLLACGASFALHAGDTIFIRSVTVKPDITSYNIKGALVQVKCSYRTQRNKIPYQLHFSAAVQQAGGNAVKATNAVSVYTDSTRKVAAHIKTYYATGEQYELNFFIPYYILALPSGKQELQLSLRAAVQPSEKEPEAPAVLSSEKPITFSIQKPPVQTFSLRCTGVTATKRDVTTFWDPDGSRPDLYYQVLLDNNELPDLVYYSDVCDNNEPCTWTKFTPLITISEGDMITIAIFDQDRFNRDDLVGLKRFTLTELKALSQSGNTIEFNQVLKFSVKLLPAP